MSNDITRNADFWNQLYIDKDTGWDIGQPTPIFVNWSKTLNPKLKILIPGCGNCYDGIYLSKQNDGMKRFEIQLEKSSLGKGGSFFLGFMLHALVLKTKIFRGVFLLFFTPLGSPFLVLKTKPFVVLVFSLLLLA